MKIDGTKGKDEKNSKPDNDAIPKISEDAVGYSVSARKFFVMSIFTCFMYKAYWGYRQFRYVDIGAKNKFFAAVCGIFLPVSFYSLMGGLEKSAIQKGANLTIKRKMPMAISFFLLMLLAKPISTLWGVAIVGTLSCVILYKVQREINALNAQINPASPPDDRFSAWDRVGILLTVGALVLMHYMPAHMR